MDLSLSDKYQKGEFTREAFMELLYKQLINACNEFGLKIDKKIEKYVKTHDIKLVKEIISYDKTNKTYKITLRVFSSIVLNVLITLNN